MQPSNESQQWNNAYNNTGGLAGGIAAQGGSAPQMDMGEGDDFQRPQTQAPVEAPAPKIQMPQTASIAQTPMSTSSLGGSQPSTMSPEQLKQIMAMMQMMKAKQQGGFTNYYA